MRIVAGKARGRTLAAPKTGDIRPTADRVRETLFNILGQWMEGLAVLDLFAGTGALALEAISRGAVRAVLVDSGYQAQKLCRENAATLGFTAQVELLSMAMEDGLRLLQRRGDRFDLIFADPPYAKRLTQDILTRVEASGVMLPGATLCVEHDKREQAPEQSGALHRTDERTFGDTTISFYRFEGELKA